VEANSDGVLLPTRSAFAFSCGSLATFGDRPALISCLLPSLYSWSLLLSLPFSPSFSSVSAGCSLLSSGVDSPWAFLLARGMVLLDNDDVEFFG